MDGFDFTFDNPDDYDPIDWGGTAWEWSWMMNDSSVAEDIYNAGIISDAFFDMITTPNLTMDEVIAEACACPEWTNAMRDFFDINNDGDDLDETAAALQIIGIIGTVVAVGNPVGMGVFAAIAVLGVIVNYYDQNLHEA